MAAVQQNITYKRELHAGDVITIRSGVLEVRDKTIQIFHEMRNEETQEVAAFTIVTGIYLDAVRRKSCTLPLEIRAKLEGLEVNQRTLYWDDTLTPDVSQEFLG